MKLKSDYYTNDAKKYILMFNSSKLNRPIFNVFMLLKYELHVLPCIDVKS